MKDLIIKNIINRSVKYFGYTVIRTEKSFLLDMDEGFKPVFESCKDYTMTSAERMYNLYKAVEYVIKNNIKGDFVECGVWKGGSAMIIAHTLMKLGVRDRNIFLYDTYEGMSEPTLHDVDHKGRDAKKTMIDSEIGKQDSIWCYAGIEEVKKNLYSTNYPMENLFFIKGKVEETIPGNIPTAISLLRLDTDWYESTYHELKHLYPLVEKNGVLIIDDYGYWQGSRKAVDEYLLEINSPVLLSRIDGTGRMAIKTL
jgi:O-methyltransferase